MKNLRETCQEEAINLVQVVVYGNLQRACLQALRIIPEHRDSRQKMNDGSLFIQQQVSPRYDVPQIVAPGEESPPAAMRNKQRRASFLPRANAIEGSLIQPRKQVSTPLPENTRIYDRGHVYSRSWNAEYLIGNEQDGYQARDYAKELRVEDPRRYYQSNNRNPQPPPPAPSHDPLPTLMLVPPIASFPRHAKSFDASRPNDLLHPDRSQYHERRSFSEHIQYNQPSLDIQKPQSKEEVSRQCQTLWHEREVLESIPLQTSIELSDDGPSAASTSFESNTESVAQVPESRRNSIFLEPPSHRRLSNAEVKRQKYKNLMLNRITQKSHPENSSIDSNGSDSTSGNTKLGSSFDSAELPLSKTNRRDSRRRSMMHLTRRVSTNLQKKIANRTFSVKYVPTRTLTRPALNYGASYELQRDYSVDTKSDSLFRDFARVDPRYETPQTSSAIEYPAGFRPAARRRSSHMMQAMAQYRSADNNDYNTTTSSVPVPAKPTCRGYYSPSRHPL
uniref:SH2 domain-containing protein n=1 Tax=Panagrellus redivivus TaxID=6233 RepID=A0A7E4UT63_PANRE